MLIENEKLYKALESALWAFCTEGEYIHAHAIYEPDDDGGLHEGMYHAAADLHEEGRTYHVWFILEDDDSITIDSIWPWIMG